MLYKDMKCSPEEIQRRQEVCDRMNILYYRKQATDNEAKKKRIDRELVRIRRAEAPWMKEAAFFLY